VKILTAEALEIKSFEDLTVWDSNLVTCIFTGINGLVAQTLGEKI
jgi:hypothetical protein